MTSNRAQQPRIKSGASLGNGRSSMLGAVRWRCIGPPRGGRVVAVAGDPQEPMVFYFGACAGGVWKTADGGTYWENISDGFFNTAAVGALAVSDSDHNVVYAGMGEACIRGDVSHGDGVYRSTDAGKTWIHLGLEDTRYIARIRVHPQDPDLVYVAALGHAYGPNEQRGVAMGSWVLSIGTAPLGHLGVGALGGWLGAPGALLVNGAILVFLGVSAAVGLPKIRRLP